MKWLPLVAVMALLACGEKETGDRGPGTGNRKPESEEKGHESGCAAVDGFGATVDVREASGAQWVEASFGLAAHVVVVGDSGTNGAFAVIDADKGGLLGKGTLPLGEGVSDDIEGFARSGELYHALTSNGRVRSYRRTGALAFELIGQPYPIDRDLVCASPLRNNCGPDFEGLCLAAAPGREGCAGFAASRAAGALVCLTIGPDGRLAADPMRTISLAPPRILSGCAIAPEGDLLYAGFNGFGANAVVRIRDWREPVRASKESLGPAGPGFCEAVAAGPKGMLYRFSDSGGSPSLMGAISCPARSP